LSVDDDKADMSERAGEEPGSGRRSPTAREALHTTLDCSFEDAVDRVQLEHELAGFESVATTRLDRLVEGVLDETVTRTALVVVCHAEIARDAVEIDPALGGLLPCTTAVYETDGTVHVHHLSATKAMRDLGCTDADETAMDALVEATGERMRTVWENIEAIDAAYDGEPAA
jgi:uncharacterized protein (DUF302 family)